MTQIGKAFRFVCSWKPYKGNGRPEQRIHGSFTCPTRTIHALNRRSWQIEPSAPGKPARNSTSHRIFAVLAFIACAATSAAAKADWQTTLGPAASAHPALFGDPIAACQAEFNSYWAGTEYTLGTVTFNPSTGIPTGVSCDYNYTGTNPFFPPVLGMGAELVCQPGQVPTALNSSGCTSATGETPGSNNGSPTPVAKSRDGNNCTDCNVGEPINPSTGNEFVTEIDYHNASMLSLEFTRYYNSYSGTLSSKIGAQWRHTYDRTITTSSTGNSVTVANVNRQDGKVIQYFSRNGITWAPTSDLVDTLQATYNTSNVLTGWIFKTSDDQIEAFNATGALLSITDRVGRKQTLSYNTLGQLYQIADSYGRKLLLAYDSSGRVHTLTDPASGIFVYGYDANNNLQTVTFPDSTIRTYVYNESSLTSGANLPHALTGIVDENNARYVTVGYNASGLANLDYLGSNVNRFSIQYSASGANKPVITDPLGTQRTYTFLATNGVNEVTAISAPGSEAACGICSSAVSFTYNPTSGFITGRTDANGNGIDYTVDGRGLEETHIEGGNGVSRETDTSWETNFHLPHQITEPGRTTVYNHDPATGNLLSVTVADSQTGASRVTTYSNYNTLGEPQTIDGPRTDISDVTHYAYDAQGNLSQTTDALGHITRITQYDAHGNPKVMLDQNNVETDFGYDQRQRLTSKTVAGALTQYKHDNAGNLKTIILPNGTQIGNGYDTAHRLTDITDNVGNHIHYTLDGLGNRIREDTYNPGGNLVRTMSRNIDPTTGWVSDLLGASGQDTRYTYDGVGKIKTQTEVTDAANYQTSNTYDGLNRLSQVQAADQGITNYGYDPFGNLETVEDPASLTTVYTYNGLGDLIELNSPDTGITLYTPDSAGDVSVKKDARPISASYTYDALNRVKTITYPTAAENVTYYYDGSNYPTSAPYAVGRLTGVADQSGITIYYYNPRGTLSSEIHVVSGVSYTTAYTYDVADNLKSVTYPSGDSATYVLNALGQIAEVDAVVGGSTKTLASNVQYMPFGPWKQQTLGNGITTTRTIDTDYRVGTIVSGSAVSRTYSYTDGRNNISAITDNITGGNSQTLGYDPVNRLAAAKGVYGNLEYQYNTSGDRTLGGPMLLPTPYNYKTGTHFLMSTGDIALASYTYDPIGNPIKHGLTTYTYNNANRLASVSGSGSPVFTYNAAGQRILKATSGFGAATTVFGYDQFGLLLQENTAAGGLGSEYFYLNGEPLALYTQPHGLLGPGAAQIYYYHNDHLGTPQALTNSSGTKAWTANYQPFGTVSLGTQTITNNLRLPGQYSDSETGFYQNGFRDYNPSYGRYMESDPTGLGGGISTYAYAGGNPALQIDPSGQVHWSGVDFSFAVTAEGFGASINRFTLWSECVDGKRDEIDILAVGPAFGFGVKGSATVSDISFDDTEGSLDPEGFDGGFKLFSAAATIGALPSPNNPRIGPSIPGVGTGLAIIKLGNNLSNPFPPGFVGGYDRSIAGSAGSSTVTNIHQTNCRCRSH